MSYVDRSLNRRSVEPFVPMLIILFIVMLGVLVVWSSQAEVIRTAKAPAVVLSSTDTQVIQHLEGGIVESIDAHVGMRVRRGDVLLRIQSLAPQSDLDERRVRRAALFARLARLTALSEGHALQFPGDFQSEFPEVTERNINLFRDEAEALSSRETALRQTVESAEVTLEGLRKQLDLLFSELTLEENRHALLVPLVETGAISRMEFLGSEAKLVASRREISNIETQIAQITQNRSIAQSELSAGVSTMRAEILNDLDEARAAFDMLNEEITLHEDVVERTVLRAPMDGIVNAVSISTIGGVVGPGQELIEIVPNGEQVRIEARVTPKDIAFVSIGQPVSVWLSAYDFARYGSLEGEVVEVGADTLLDDDGTPYYRVMVETPQSVLIRQGTEHPVLPGMTGEVLIVTGARTVFEYMIGPVIKARERVFSEN